MPVITISRQYGSRGREIAHLLCDRLGYRYFDKDLMAQLGAEMGLPPDQLVDRPEDKHQAQSLVDRLFSRMINPFGDPAQMAFPAVLEARQQISVETFQRLIRAAYERGQVVVMGRGGQAVLQDAPDVLHVRVVAPIEMRIQRVQEVAGVTAGEARRRLDERDAASADYVQRFYGVDPTDPTLYDLTINMRKATPEAAAALIVKVLECLPVSARSELPEGASSARS
jgi:cytidylate kinase